ncbi:MAG: AMP-binding protein, partial [Alphaproteobacteria bacterium]
MAKQPKSRSPKKSAKAAAKRSPAARKKPIEATRKGAASGKNQGSIYDRHLEKNPANYQPLTPLHFIERAAATFPNKLSAIHGKRRFTWQETYDRARRLGSALAKRGIKKNDTVSVMLPNIPEMVECHFGVPMCGAVLGALNTRLDAATIAFILDHSETKLLITDREFAPTIKAALAQLGRRIPVIDVRDPEYAGPGELLGQKDYEALLAEGDRNYQWHWPKDEWDAISLNYTSGTTGNPKGVVYHHRGAYLGAVGNLVTWSMPQQPVYLWTLPMFHCNGWTFPWAIACVAGINVCLRRVEAKAVYDAIADHKVSHFCGAPIVLAMVTNAKANERREFDHVVNIMTAAAPPPPAVLEAIEKMG